MNDIIWNFLYRKLQNEYGAAGLMGNLYVESKLNPKFLQGSYARNLNLSGEEYTKAVDNGSYTNFVRDSAGYGLAQWTHWSRKEALLQFSKKKNTSIGDLNMQLEFLWEELQSYKTCLSVLKNATSVREASDIVVERYEKPKNQTEEGKQSRANYGMQFYSLYTGRKSTQRVVVTADRVNIRLGNGKEYARILLANKDSSYEWIATAENGWHAIRLPKQVGWISGEFSKIER